MSRMHRCAALGCEQQVPLNLLMCARHWRLVPRPIQSAVWATYTRGQETALSKITPAYLHNVEEAIKAVALKEGRPLPAKYQGAPKPEDGAS